MIHFDYLTPEDLTISDNFEEKVERQADTICITERDAYRALCFEVNKVVDVWYFTEMFCETVSSKEELDEFALSHHSADINLFILQDGGSYHIFDDYEELYSEYN